MDFNELQRKLFEIEPSDRQSDIAKLVASANAQSTMPADTNNIINETVEVPQGSLKIDKDYSVTDFAKLAGVNEKQFTGSKGQLKGTDAFTKSSKPGGNESPHPARDKLVGDSIDYDKDERIAKLEKRVEALEAMLNEKAVSKKQQQFFGIVNAMQKGEMPKDGEAGEVAKDMAKKDVKKFAKTKHKGLPTKVSSSINTNDIKNRLYDALNKKMGNK